LQPRPFLRTRVPHRIQVALAQDSTRDTRESITATTGGELNAFASCALLHPLMASQLSPPPMSRRSCFRAGVSQGRQRLCKLKRWRVRRVTGCGKKLAGTRHYLMDAGRGSTSATCFKRHDARHMSKLPGAFARQRMSACQVPGCSGILVPRWSLVVITRFSPCTGHIAWPAVNIA